ncbi:MAG TPA: carboxypeptidase-like regulatory domain-containing protein [Blastocatellia bacterium]|nr:carboxypeptidase-like regulatory domain-containing protein [Blastocatellia bacterium]
MNRGRLSGRRKHIWPAWIVTCAILAALVSPLSVAAQIGAQGQISGFVRDQQGAAVTPSTITVTNTGTQIKRTAQTDSNGYYVVANLPAGLYDLSVEQAGFKKFVQTNIKLDADGKLAIDVQLEVGAVTDAVTVTAENVQIETSTARVGRTLEGKQVQDLALNGRNPVFLQMLKAGVLGGNPNGFNFTPSTGGVNVNGSRADENSILLDGVQQVRTRSAGVTTGVVTVDTVQEIQILTSNYAPEFGRANGGQTLFVTKSGTRQFHGALWHFLRNSALDSNTWDRNRTPVTPVTRVALDPPPLKFNQPGYAIGGPVYIPGHFNTGKEKLFFFWSQEWTRYRPTDTVRATVPSVAIRNGNLSELGVAIRDPNGGNFSGAIIPANRMSPIGRAIVNAYPLPNCTGCFPGSTDNYINALSRSEDTRKDVLRLDYYQGIHHISFRASQFAWRIQGNFRGSFDYTPDNHSRPNYTGGFTLVSTLKPTLINEFTFGASADVVELGVRGRFSRSDLGIVYPYIFPGTKELEDKVPTISITGFTDIDGGPYPGRSAGPIYTWTDTVTWVHGSHTFKTGVNIERSGENDLDQVNIQQVPGSTNNQNGRFEFRPDRSGGTGVAVADALLGLFRNYGEIGRKSYSPWRSTTFEWFVQDNWKVTPRLTVEYGVRYNLWPPWYSLWNNIATFDARFYTPGLLSLDSTGRVVVAPGADFILARYNGISLPGGGFPDSAKGRVPAADIAGIEKLFRGIPRGVSETHKNVFEPRLGVAYALNEKTTIRAGLGVFHNRVLLNDSTLLGGNAPLQFLVGVENGLADAPGGVISSFNDSIRFPFNLTSQDPNFKHPTAYNWSLTIQRELPAKFLVEIGYVGKAELFLPRERNINQLLPGQNFRRDATGKVIGTVPISNALRPYLGHAQIRLSENAGRANYQSFQVTLNRRFANGFSFDLAYTWSKSIDNASDKRNLLPNAYDDRNFRGPSDFDRPHVLVFNYNYELPIGRGKRFLDMEGKLGAVVDGFIGGWQLSGISFIRSGTPILMVSNNSQLNIPIDALGVGTGSGPQFPSLRGALHQVDAKLGSNIFSDPTLFTLPAPGTEGNVGRNVFRSPKFQNHDLAIFKNFHIKEGMRLQFRTEMFNFVNHPNLSLPDLSFTNNGMITSFTDPNYGQWRPLTDAEKARGLTVPSRNFGVITSKTGDRRTIQLALKLMF